MNAMVFKCLISFSQFLWSQFSFHFSVFFLVLVSIEIYQIIEPVFKHRFPNPTKVCQKVFRWASHFQLSSQCDEVDETLSPVFENTFVSCRPRVYSRILMHFDNTSKSVGSFSLVQIRIFICWRHRRFTLTAILTFSRYEIYQDEVKPGGLNLNFLREFMDLPQSYLAPGSAIKFRKFFLFKMRTLITYSIRLWIKRFAIEPLVIGK